MTTNKINPAGTEQVACFEGRQLKFTVVIQPQAHAVPTKILPYYSDLAHAVGLATLDPVYNAADVAGAFLPNHARRLIIHTQVHKDHQNSTLAI